MRGKHIITGLDDGASPYLHIYVTYNDPTLKSANPNAIWCCPKCGDNKYTHGNSYAFAENRCQNGKPNMTRWGKRGNIKPDIHGTLKPHLRNMHYQFKCDDDVQRCVFLHSNCQLATLSNEYVFDVQSVHSVHPMWVSWYFIQCGEWWMVNGKWNVRDMKCL